MANGFSLALPSGDQIKQEIVQEVTPIPSEICTQINTQVLSSVDALMQMDMQSMKDRNAVANTIDNLGAAPMKRSANKNMLMSRSLHTLSAKGGDGNEVANNLSALSKQMNDLDPTVLGSLKKTLLNNPIARYFAKFEKADSVIAGIVQNLEKGQQTLKDDSKTLQIEHDKLKDDTIEILRSIEMGMQMDSELERRLELCDDPERVAFIRDEVLFPIRQRIQDLHGLAVVNQQGMAAMLIIIRNNRELIRGVERAKAVTIRALETAVMVAGALYDQKLVLNAIDTLNKATNSMIAKTSVMLKQNSMEIQKQAVESTLSVDTLKQAWSDIIETIDGLNSYRREALPKMAATISEFQTLLDEGSEAVRSLDSGNQMAASMLDKLE